MCPTHRFLSLVYFLFHVAVLHCVEIAFGSVQIHEKNCSLEIFFNVKWVRRENALVRVT